VHILTRFQCHLWRIQCFTITLQSWIAKRTQPLRTRTSSRFTQTVRLTILPANQGCHSTADAASVSPVFWCGFVTRSQPTIVVGYFVTCQQAGRAIEYQDGVLSGEKEKHVGYRLRPEACNDVAQSSDSDRSLRESFQAGITMLTGE
jgi:hypothetical protein